MAVVKWGGVINASAGISELEDAVITALPNGGYAVVWHEGHEATRIYIRVFDALGNLKTTQTLTSRVGEVEGTKVTTLDDGSFVVTWSDGEKAIQLQKFSMLGVPDPAGIVTVASTTNVNEEKHVPAVASGGAGWVAVWKNQSTASGGDNSLWFKRQSGEELIITSGAGATDPTVAELENGNHVVAWGQGGFIWFSIVTPAGVVSAPKQASTVSSGSPSITALSNGNFAITWHESNSRRAGTKVFEADGDLLHNGFSDGTWVAYQPHVVALTKGGFAGGYAVVYTDNVTANGRASEDIYLRVVKADGTSAAPTLITDGTTRFQGQKLACITELKDGRLSLIWENWSTSPSSIQNQIIDAREESVIVEGTSQNDIYVGTTSTDGKFSDVDELYGYAGNDTLYGGGGGDFLVGGIDGDSLVGGAGNDWAIYTGAAADPNGNGVTANLANAASNLGEAKGDQYNSIENLQGSAHRDILTGNEGNNQILGENGDDTLNGSAGNDTLNGGAGSDRFYGGAGADLIDGDDDAGWNDVSYQTAAAAIRLVLADTTGGSNGGDALGDRFDQIDAYVGSRFNDTMIGKAGYDTLYGDVGNDLLQGGTGDNSRDYLNGQVGDDTLEGGGGNDVLIGGAGNDFVSYARSNVGVVVNLSTGGAQVSDGDAAGDEITEMEGIIGSNHNDQLSGASTNDTLEGGLGNDTLNGGGGFDYASYASSGTAVVVNLATGAKSGGAAGDVYNSIEHLIGSAQADTLIGDGNANVLRGMDGNDVLAGGAGADMLDGGNGSDTVSYAGASAGVTVNLADTSKNSGEAAGDAYASVENAIGTDHADVFIGNAAVNVFQGGKGNDIYHVGAGDVVIENADEGDDKVVTDGNYTLGGHIQDLEGTGNAALTLTGNVHNNTITGNVAGNWIDGGAGADTMRGGGGDDIYVIDNAGDVIIDFEGNNSVVSTVQLNLNNLQGNFANITVAEGFNFNVEGTSGHNVLKGNAFANILKGNGGNDKLYGILGNDKLYGGTGRDTFVFDTRLSKTKNVDKIYDFKSRDDSFHLDNAIFTKLGSGTAARPKVFKSDMFVESTRAQDREDRIIYDKKTGNLYYDKDGTGGSAQVKIATITNKTKLYYHDFYVI